MLTNITSSSGSHTGTARFICQIHVGATVGLRDQFYPAFVVRPTMFCSLRSRTLLLIQHSTIYKVYSLQRCLKRRHHQVVHPLVYLIFLARRQCAPRHSGGWTQILVHDAMRGSFDFNENDTVRVVTVTCSVD